MLEFYFNNMFIYIMNFNDGISLHVQEQHQRE